MGPGIRRDDVEGLIALYFCCCRSQSRPASSSRRAEFLRQHENLARTRDIGPVAIEVGDQPLHVRAIHGAIERGLVGELVARLMQRGIADAPEPPRLLDAKRLGGVGQMLSAVPLIERRAFGGVGNGGANDEIGYWHRRFSVNSPVVIPGSPQGWVATRMGSFDMVRPWSARQFSADRFIKLGKLICEERAQ